jgi:cytochrome P450
LYKSIDNYIRLNATGNAALADFYPILRHLPAWCSPHKRETQQQYKHEAKLYTDLYLQAKSSLIKAGSIKACVCQDAMVLQAQENYSDEYTAYILAQLWEAGSDTTAIEIYSFIQALILYPEVQAQGQAEIDAVLGDNRIPTWDDIPRLPYIRACVKETLRWHPVAKLGAFPHATIEDDIYKGYRIPKGAYVVLNTWAIHRGSERFDNPNVFNPKRYSEDSLPAAESANHVDVSKRDHFGFGAGRRICPGLDIADRNIWLCIARFFWAFDVKPAMGIDGKSELPVQDDFIPGFAAIPRPYKAEITPRSERKSKLIREEWGAAKQTLDEDGQYL